MIFQNFSTGTLHHGYPDKQQCSLVTIAPPQEIDKNFGHFARRNHDTLVYEPM